MKPASKSASRKSVSNANTQVYEAKVDETAEAMETDELVVEEVKNDPVDLDQVASNLTNSFRVSKFFPTVLSFERCSLSFIMWFE